MPRIVSTDRPDTALEACLATGRAGVVAPEAVTVKLVEVEIPHSFAPRA